MKYRPVSVISLCIKSYFNSLTPEGRYATALINEGVDPATVSGALGHSVVSTTMNVYSHMFKENNIKSCDAITNALKHIETSPDKSKSEPETKLDEDVAS